jgi:NAD(P)-dependent dehydrogenase (short-subunit alcohol dehydrogenase family)
MNYKKPFSLAGKTVVITGGLGMIGSHCTALLIALGARVEVIDHPDLNTKKIEEFLRKKGVPPNYTHQTCDLESGCEREKLINGIKNKLDQIDILINAAGYVASESQEGWSDIFERQKYEQFEKALTVNLTAVFHVSQGLSPLLSVNGSGSIINIGSIYGKKAPNYSIYEGTDMHNPAGYAASKAGLIQLTRWLATTLSPNIRVNMISPGGIYRDQEENFVRAYNKNTPMGRMATEQDVLGAIAYFASDASTYVTGQNLVIDGGFSL